MYYIINKEYSHENWTTLYTLYHVYSLSKFKIEENTLKKLMKDKKIIIKNAKLDYDYIEVKGWATNLFRNRYDIFKADKNIVTHRTGDREYCGMDTEGNRLVWSGMAMGIDIKNNKIANARVDGSVYKFSDINMTKRNYEFEVHIKNEYDKYVAKSKMLGHKLSFNYVIIDNEVILTKYTGESRNVILPSFITSIAHQAFYLSKIETIKLNEGIKFIGSAAFVICELSELEIPSTVKMISAGAFEINKVILINVNKRKFYKCVKFIGDEESVLIL